MPDNSESDSAIEKPDTGKTPPSRPSPQQRSVNRAINELVRWMPLGGSGWAFVSVLLKQEWVTSLALFPVMGMSAVWAAYTKNFIEQLQEIYGERGRNDANALVGWLDSLNETVKWQLSGFEGQYLKLQVKPCKDYETEGFSPDVSIPQLKDVFVPLSIAEYRTDKAGRSSGQMQMQEMFQPQSIWDILRKSDRDRDYRQILIRKQGGFGKTTMLRHVALIYSLREQTRKPFRGPDRVPFLLRLRDFAEVWKLEEIPSLPKLITDYHFKHLSRKKPLSPPPKWVETLLESGRALVMLDGFDEVAQAQKAQVSRWIGEQMQEYSDATFILTSRPKGFQEYVGKKPTMLVSIDAFTPEQQEDFILRWYLCQEKRFRDASSARDVAIDRSQDLINQLRTKPEVMKMAANPLLLNMITTFHRLSTSRTLPQMRSELYAGICELQLRERPKARSIPMPLSYEKSLVILQKLALLMVEQNTTVLDRENLVTFLELQVTLGEEQVSPQEWLKSIVDVAELLVEREAGEFEFPHLSFQGYFAATGLADDRGPDILGHWNDSWWRETILFFTAKLPAQKFSQILKGTNEAGERQAIELAGQCLREYPQAEKLDSGLQREAQKLRSSRYSKLEELLKASKWKEADYETYVLMITTVDKEEGDAFSSADLENFPCEDLLKIDRLWVEASAGHFGFSVQKTIWQKCGSPMSYNGDYEKFMKEVGWQSGGRVVSYENFKFSTSHSPKGELPGLIYGRLRFSVNYHGTFSASLLPASLFARSDL